MDCILPPLLSFCISQFMTPLKKITYVTDLDMLFHMINLILITTAKLHCMSTILYQSFPLIICR